MATPMWFQGQKSMISSNPVGSDRQQEPVFMHPTDTEATEEINPEFPSNNKEPTNRTASPTDRASGDTEGGRPLSSNNDDEVRAPEGEGTSESGSNTATDQHEYTLEEPVIQRRA